MSTLAFENCTLSNLSEKAKLIIEAAQGYSLWCFTGEMGAGKTTLIRFMCKELGVTDDITSPTFSLVNEYVSASGKTIYHFDFYRIRSIDEVYDIGYEDYFYSGNICLIEWPSVIEELLKNEKIFSINISKIGEDTRSIVVSGN
jgi:tRNA threonylcarbamoyladenosine biosynthesis protein TsaE